MKIEISIGFDKSIVTRNFNGSFVLDTETIYEHDGYYESIDEAIEALQYLKMCEERGDFVE